MVGLVALAMTVVMGLAGGGVGEAMVPPMPPPHWLGCDTGSNVSWSGCVFVPVVMNPSPDPDTTLRAMVTDVPPAWAEGLRAWLAVYLPSPEDDHSGIWVLEPSMMAEATVVGGQVTFSGVREGRYCVVVGPIGSAMVPLRNETGFAAVYRVERGQVLDLGEVYLLRACNPNVW